MTNSQSWVPVYFPTSPALLANTQYWIMAATGDGASGSNGNDFRFYYQSIENDANSKAQLPFGGLKRVYYNGTDFTTVAASDVQIVPFKLYLDTAGEFTVPASGLPASRIQGGM